MKFIYNQFNFPLFKLIAQITKLLSVELSLRGVCVGEEQNLRAHLFFSFSPKPPQHMVVYSSFWSFQFCYGGRRLRMG